MDRSSFLRKHTLLFVFAVSCCLFGLPVSGQRRLPVRTRTESLITTQPNSPLVDGDLDTSFGAASTRVPLGVATTFFGADPSASVDQGLWVGVQSTGKVIVVGVTGVG